jgi:hypothetical protein
MEENINNNEREYAVKPHHTQPRLNNGRDSMFKYRNIMNIAFMVLAIVGVIIYTQSDYKMTSAVILIFAVVLKFIEVSLRMFHK